MNNVSFETEDRIAVDGSARADDPNQAGADALNGNGFYRFKIGDFQATVISDGQGPIPVSPIFVMNASVAELAPVLRANFMQPVIQATNNPLVVDTGRERILVDTGFGEKIGPPFGSFPRLQANLVRAGIAPESIDLVVISHGHLDHIGGLVTKSGALAFPKAQFVFVDTFFGYDEHAPIPLVILDWDIDQIEGAVLESWLPSVFSRLEGLARLCGARMGSIGAFIEDKSAGMILLQQALRRGMPAQPSWESRTRPSIGSSKTRSQRRSSWA
jgi:Metallo-beta-lactamase superfamily